MITTNINIAIVDMVKEKFDNETISPVGECYANDSITMNNVSIDGFASNEMDVEEPSHSGAVVTYI